MAAVHSRAYLLIEQELGKFEADPVPGIRLYPTYAGNLFTLSARIKGVRDTLWEGGILKLRLRFSESFNYVPPEANFVTVPFHPNVDAETGRVACPLLDDRQKWGPAVSVADILRAIQRQLASPDAGLVVNAEAAAMLTDRPDQYLRIVKQCVQMSQIVENSPEAADAASPQLQAGAEKPPVTIEYDPDFLNRPKTLPPPPLKKISFEEYHADWARIATSLPATGKTFSAESQWSDPEVLSAKMERHRRLKYGSVGQAVRQSPKEKQENNLQRVDQMRKLYLSQKHASNLSARTPSNEVPINTAAGQYPEDDEAEELLRWTKELPAQAATAVDSK